MNSTEVRSHYARWDINMRDGTLISEIVIFHSIFRKLFISILQRSVSSSVSGAGLLQA